MASSSRPAFAPTVFTTGAGAPADQAIEPASLDLIYLRRLTFGYSEFEHARLRQQGLRSWLSAQLDPQSIDDSELENRLADFPSLSMGGQELYDTYGWTNQAGILQELRSARLVRAVHSRRQLFERMVEFWTDHFNIHLDVGDPRFLKTVDDREVVRAHAMGSFPDMLRASTRSAAMLSYLDNDTNVAGHANENYARELMELHSLGVDGPYTEVDVREVSRCFTGWTYVHLDDPGEFGAFRFDAALHDDDPKVVLGQSLPAGGGIADAEAVLDILALHPSTAKFIATKLARWLLAYDPPALLVRRVADVYLATGGSIPAMLAEMLDPQSNSLVRSAKAPKLKRPIHLAASILRAFEVPLDSPLDVLWNSAFMGQDPFAWPAPDGYPDVLGAWASNLLTRWRFCSQLVNGWMAGSGYSSDDVIDMFRQVPREQWPSRVDRLLTGGSLTSSERNMLREYADAFEWPNDSDVLQVIELAATTPTFQVY